ncbi:MAG: NAD(P)H-dependent oxidoreductase [Proteobacteria bacterium]|nr:NAD(P)H-dependent oxidoreductase [Pseudomonadota bacterium]
MKNILVINGHPDDKSLCHALAGSYQSGAAGAATCAVLHLCDLKFDPILRFGYREKMPLEPDLIRAQEMIRAADHIVFVYPSWWGTYPALLKGFLDRMWLPGFAFKFRPGKPFPEQFLRGKTGRVIVTMNTPIWFYRLVYRMPGVRGIRDCVMKFCGISPVQTTILSPIENKSPEYYQKLLAEIKSIGARDAKKIRQSSRP